MFTFERTPLKQAIAYFQKKITVPTTGWSDLSEIEQTVAFTIAGMKAEILADAREIMDKLIVDGTSIDEARNSFRQLMEDTGWLTGESNKQKAWRTDLIIDTNLKTSNAIGRYEYQNDPDVVEGSPYMLYRHGDSVVPRPAHLALDGTVYRRDDPRAEDLYAPRGFFCSCLNFAISEREYQENYAGTDKDYTESDVPDTIEHKGKEISTDADKGFQLAPNTPSEDRRAEIVDRMRERLPPDIFKLFEKDVNSPSN